MDFPDYVPTAVRILCIEIEMNIAVSQDQRDCIARLVHRPENRTEMEPVYGILTDIESEGGGQAVDFIAAAFSAQMDFGRYRDAIDLARKLNDKIGIAAAELASLLREIQDTGVNSPSEFYSVRDLLLQTDYRDEPSKSIWKGCKDLIVRGNKADLAFQHAWKKVPTVDLLLDTLANAANDYEPQEPSSVVAAGIASRKKTPKTAYLRAFWYLLAGEHGFTISPRVKDAMATTATVVLNEPDTIVSADDVSKALLIVARL